MNKGLGAPHFFTNRLYIRPIEWEDIDDFFDVCSQSEVTQYLTFNPHEYLSDTHRVIENMMRAYSMGQSVNFAIVLKSTNHLIGSASLTFNYVNRSAEVGYLLDAKYWNQGYMSEAIQALIEVAFNYYRVEFLYAKHRRRPNSRCRRLRSKSSHRAPWHARTPRKSGRRRLRRSRIRRGPCRKDAKRAWDRRCAWKAPAWS